jgi:hypothetical protein
MEVRMYKFSDETGLPSPEALKAAAEYRKSVKN